ncbi:MAG TPA: ABC transporter ATP-binding protein, partial [Ramlibacter sp.]|nr:ABC transporter ATP-binding protein [Ramlibacter sp.]
MARVTLDAVRKRYGSGGRSHQALDGVSLQIDEGEFVALLGPSGSGKTTLLRAIAGLEAIDAGTIDIGGERVAGPGLHQPPEARRLAVVFQNHALWPHMNVHDNVLFPLHQAGLSGAAARERVLQALAAVELGGLHERFPGQLSGGQKQRVALARAMVGAPRVILFDEPLASLDVALRRGMMRHIARARSAEAAMVYVTHNQEEALALADRVAVLFDGRIEQLDAPQLLCRQPRTERVAQFVGAGNVLDAQAVATTGAGEVQLEIGGHRFVARCRSAPANAEVRVCIAPSALVPAPPGPGLLQARLEFAFFQGHGYAAEATLTAPGATVGLHLPASARPRTG